MTRAFTLLETTVAFAVLTTALIAAWAVIGSADRSQSALWDEFMAGELAVSVLEHTLSGSDCKMTPPAGRDIPLSELMGANPRSPLPELRIILHVSSVNNREDLCEARAVVQWKMNNRTMSLERSLRRRLQQ